MVWILGALLICLLISAVLAWRSRPDNRIAREHVKLETELVPFNKRSYARRIAWNLYRFSSRSVSARTRKSKRRMDGDRRRAANWRRTLDNLVSPAEKRSLRAECRSVAAKGGV